MVTDGNQTYCSGSFAMYTNFKSLCYTLETNIIWYVDYTSIKMKKKNPKYKIDHWTLTECEKYTNMVLDSTLQPLRNYRFFSFAVMSKKDIHIYLINL